MLESPCMYQTEAKSNLSPQRTITAETNSVSVFAFFYDEGSYWTPWVRDREFGDCRPL